MLRAHPRVCGENLPLFCLEGACCGSSPRVRGKRVVGVVHSRVGGLIPACAGKTEPLVDVREEKPAHPRVCGENVVISRNPDDAPGSSPRVRGKH